ncbi:hypothetical protein FA15DRAFT_739274 [Coprinopsis marcescibilis]|uniref:SnoaL-like domain-containing protein n=1 Tax=Coprinopsis marcescibilis TaxID=230819 RepID=A0A5C3KAU9_COPMA|nr:hypothetical protein FA15DRAFT_739274 [Coprinopsis marcescibilis]
MRLFSTILTVCSLAAVASASSVNGRPRPGPQVCDPKARGPKLEAKQQEAMAGFAHLFLGKHDVKAAYDRYVPGEYIQHNPFAEQGREFAIDFLSESFADPTVTTTNITVFGGQGYGAMHFKLTTPNTTFAVVDYLRFKGTCIVEHWDVLQVITGNEPNPIAFF